LQIRTTEIVVVVPQVGIQVDGCLRLRNRLVLTVPIDKHRAEIAVGNVVQRTWTQQRSRRLDRLVVATHRRQKPGVITVRAAELRRIALGYMHKERCGDTLQETALFVHEVFLRQVEVECATWQYRAHFFAVSADMMRGRLVHRARACGASKRDDGAGCVPLEGALKLASDSVDRDRAKPPIALGADCASQLDNRLFDGATRWLAVFSNCFRNVDQSPML
jgi:hypothetical protein